jgi:hypothetical protein
MPCEAGFRSPTTSVPPRRTVRARPASQRSRSGEKESTPEEITTSKGSAKGGSSPKPTRPSKRSMPAPRALAAATRTISGEGSKTASDAPRALSTASMPTQPAPQPKSSTRAPSGIGAKVPTKRRIQRKCP